MFEQYAHALAEKLPHLHLEGANYPPPYINNLLSNVLFYVRMVLIGLILGGPGRSTESRLFNSHHLFILWTQENKLTAIILLVIVGGQIEGHLLSTGAFEVYLNGKCKFLDTCILYGHHKCPVIVFVNMYVHVQCVRWLT